MEPSSRRDGQILRILGSLRTLSEGDRPTVYQLAARCRVQRESIYRDLPSLVRAAEGRLAMALGGTLTRWNVGWEAAAEIGRPEWLRRPIRHKLLRTARVYGS
jgi:hypothetical protein